jgi:probable F420-dependent oxidoreductase
MRFGIQHAIGDPAWDPAVLTPDAMRRFARAAEAGGFDAIGFTDHPAPSTAWVASGGEGTADWAVGLGFCAAVTDTIRLLTFVLVPGYRNPLLAAHQLATLDAVSGGRLTVGLGTGYLFSELKALGGVPGDRRADFDAALGLFLQSWSAEPVVATSASFNARGNLVGPPVVQRPHPPLWIHGNGRWGIERAARFGQGWLGMMTGDSDVLVRTTRTTPLPDLDTVARRIDEVRTATAVHGRDSRDVEIVLAGVWPMLDARTGWSVDEYLATVATLEDMGVDCVISTCCGDDPGMAVATVERFAADIIGPSRL